MVKPVVEWIGIQITSNKEICPFRVKSCSIERFSNRGTNKNGINLLIEIYSICCCLFSIFSSSFMTCRYISIIGTLCKHSVDSNIFVLFLHTQQAFSFLLDTSSLSTAEDLIINVTVSW